MRVVLDSNVLIAAYATEGLCHALFELCLRRHTLILSEHILAEVEEKLCRKLHVPAAVAREIRGFLKQQALIHDPVPLPASVCRDRDDLAVLGLAVAAGAECLITGDQDLLTLKKFQGIPIFSPREFYHHLLGK